MFKTILINIAILLGLFLLMEAAVRLFVPQIGPLGVESSLIQHGRFGSSHGLAPSVSGSNYGVLTYTTHDGFIAYTSDQDQYERSVNGVLKNWLLLGDSVTMPIGVESDSSFAGRLAHAVSDSVRVLNSALIGYSVADYLNIAESIIGSDGHGLNRIIMVWCLNDIYGDATEVSHQDDIVAEDLVDTAEHDRTAAVYADRQTVRESQGRFMRFVNRNVYSYQWLMSAVFDREQAYFEYDRQFYSEDNPFFAAAIDRLGIIRDIAESNGIRFDLIVMPYEYQFRSGDFQPQDVLLKALQQKGISAYDAQGALEGYPDIPSLYMYGDGIHFTKKGHRLIREWMGISGILL